MTLPRTPAANPPPVSADGAGGATAWQGVGARQPQDRTHRWRGFLWSLVYPYRGNRLLPTLPGVLVLAVAMGIAAAAYNTSNNILFITLSLLLACMVFSGVLSWANLKGVTWRLRVQPPLRVGQEESVSLELRNEKRLLPTYGLWFEVTASGLKRTARLPLRERLDARGTTRLDWSVCPEKRGPLRVELMAVGSLFPFGFLKKLIGSELHRDVLVWPAPIEYQRFALASWRQPGRVEMEARTGQGGDLRALRAYAQGDSQRLVHWKASARLRRLMVRQFTAEAQSGFALWVQTSAEVWGRPVQFELLCSFAATLAEDLFRAGRLVSVSIDGDAPLPVRRVPDLERFLDRLSLLDPATQPYQPPARPSSGRRANVLTFAPDGARGVLAYVDGEKAAAA